MVASLGTPRPSIADVERLLDGPADLCDVRDVLRPDPGTGEKITRRFFELCENPRTRQWTLKLLRSRTDSDVAGRLLAAWMTRLVFHPMLRFRPLDDGAAKLEILAAQLGGIAVLRYVTGVEPVASMSLDDLVAMVAPGVQATLGARR